MKNLLPVLLFFWSAAFRSQVTTNISFPHEDKIVYGCITVPAGPGPFPAIVIAPGSGAVDRDMTITVSGGNFPCLYPGLLGTTIRSYKDLGDALAAAGYVVLRYNKIEYTYSSNPGIISFTKLWLPFESAIEYVRKRPEVDSTNIILIGHSEGSALIPYVAKSRFDIKALISLAGARTPLDSMMAKQIVDFTQKCGGNMAQAQQQAAAILAYFNDVRTGNYNGSTPALFGVPPAVWSDYFQATDPVAQNYNACIRPTLFLGMGDDINVPPSELVRLQNDVTVPADFWSIPGANHYMTYSTTPVIAKAVPDTIIYWLSKLGLVTALKKQADKQPEIALLPNPASDVLTVSSSVALTSLKVFDCTGRELLSEFLSGGNFDLDVSAYPPGVYLVRCGNGQQSVTRKFIKD